MLNTFQNEKKIILMRLGPSHRFSQQLDCSAHAKILSVTRDLISDNHIPDCIMYAPNGPAQETARIIHTEYRKRLHTGPSMCSSKALVLETGNFGDLLNGIPSKSNTILAITHKPNIISIAQRLTSPCTGLAGIALFEKEHPGQDVDTYCVQLRQKFALARAGALVITSAAQSWEEIAYAERTDGTALAYNSSFIKAYNPVLGSGT